MMEEWLLLKDGGICRCCALEGPSKDLVSKYSWMGDDEIYSDMLRECFNITLVTVEEGSNGGICEVCITQLRSAYKFRQHVLHTEEQFKKKLESKILCDSAFVKLEIPPETSDTDMDPMGDNDDNSDYEVPLKKIKDELESEMELMKQKKTPAKTIASKSTRTLKKKASVEPETSKKDHASKPRKCMVCGYNYLSIPDLNRHLNNNHDVTEKPKDVLCDTCGKTFSDAMSLRRHKYRYCPKVKPKCTVCGLEFHKESMLEQHMLRGHDAAGNPKKTHRNPRGQVVSNPDALRHGKVSNCAAKKAKCDKCNLVFDKKFEFYRHMRRMHTIVCGLCYISFETHEQQDEHLRDCHKVDIAHHALVFDGEKEFMIWKSRLELESNAYFVNRVSDDGSGYYRCCLKTCLGRNDLPSTVQNCPARIKVNRATDTNQLTVSYQSGHICTIKLTRKCDRKLQCSECKHVVDNFEQLYSHLEGQHQVPINVQHLKFRSEQEFQAWKESVEKSEAVKFTRRSTLTENSKAGLITKNYYYCSMSEAFRDRNRIRKDVGTVPSCPARINTRLINGDVNVVYQSTHVTHDKARYNLTRNERLYLANRIRNGDSLTAILKNHVPTRKGTLKKTDLYNIIRHFKIDRSTVNYDTPSGFRRVKSRNEEAVSASNANVRLSTNEDDIVRNVILARQD